MIFLKEFQPMHIPVYIYIYYDHNDNISFMVDCLHEVTNATEQSYKDYKIANLEIHYDLILFNSFKTIKMRERNSNI